MIWIFVANVLGWPIIHFGISMWFTNMPADRFDPGLFLFCERSWENSGKWYVRWLGIKRWKQKLPDAAAWFGNGFSKRKIKRRSPEYLETFVKETCRGEAAHWATALCTPIFFVWNPPWACVVMAAYAVVANLPCIVVQRYNRITLQKILRLSQPGLGSAKQREPNKSANL